MPPLTVSVESLSEIASTFRNGYSVATVAIRMTAYTMALNNLSDIGALTTDTFCALTRTPSLHDAFFRNAFEHAVGGKEQNNAHGRVENIDRGTERVARQAEA